VRFQNAEVRELAYVSLPHNDYFEVDLHRPYIDTVVLVKDGTEYTRVKEVMDVWMDSGAMPFAQDPTNVLYPADFISEGIDQTRGWFYTLHAIGTIMERGKAYHNVICLGHILDKDGKKMSKSLGNTVDPWEMIEKYGVDTVRLWMYSVNQPGEPKNFDERTLAEIEKRVFNLIDNVYAFYDLYRDPAYEKSRFTLENMHILDAWILARQSELIERMTKRLDAYQLLEPVREMRDFVDDLSTWYVRRSRDRLKEGDSNAKQTLHYVLVRLAQLLAPFAPFAAEELYQKLRTDGMPLSVHLCEWPAADQAPQYYSEDLLRDMKETRRIVSLALEARQKANIKIRQPLETLHAKTELTAAFLDVIRDEVNVKTVILDTAIEDDVRLNTTLTPELLEEGEVRECIRAIQDLRKEKNLSPKDVLDYAVPAGKEALFDKYRDEIVRVTNTRF
jgi:isoleucyl-tRNA synthetase